ncbi:MAG: hypothetical protein HYY20_05995 [Candidatus Tectomicrobia bacterium]|uniref:Uncharacterized protein n=1 Tax=Tectimicrobiota bacterium TaxID=2528274 RepID=A0A932CNJ8_UNCTE|nr:hypothetical protein [Candidatus Tectomicrobia bacterium]
MKRYMPLNTARFTRGLVPAILAITLLSASGPVLASMPVPANPRVLPPQSEPYGKSYGEWGAAWWQWALSIPEAQNPLVDTTGEFCDVGQSGRVWFLGWSFGTSVEKSCTIPEKKAIFTPVFNWIFGAGVFDCEPTVPGVTCDVEILRQAAAENTEAAEILEVTIDGVELQNVRDYRASSPEPFAVTFPEGAVFGIPAGTYYPHVTDGYWLMLAPLSVGEHEIRIRVKAPNTIFGLIKFESVYHLTVAPRNE